MSFDDEELALLVVRTRMAAPSRPALCARVERRYCMLGGLRVALQKKLRNAEVQASSRKMQEAFDVGDHARSMQDPEGSPSATPPPSLADIMAGDFCHGAFWCEVAAQHY